jgi:hypothetical protein
LGAVPEIFNGSRKDLHCFIQSFSLYWEMNADHPAMANPYKRTLIYLGLIRGPDVDHWKDSYFGTLSDKVRAWRANPADHDGQDPNYEQCWNAFNTAFTRQFRDATEREVAL